METPDATGFATKDSGQRHVFSSGAQRDVQTGKGRYDLIPPQLLENLAKALEGPLGEDRNVLLGLSLLPMRPLLRLAALYGRGAVKYGPGNWLKGMPLSRTFDSLARHTNSYKAMLADEDHLAAVAWNAFTLIETEARILAGLLPKELLDLGPNTSNTTIWSWMKDILDGDPGKPVQMSEQEKRERQAREDSLRHEKDQER